MTTDTSERGLEELIVRNMTGRTDVLVPAHVATETSVSVAGGTGWLLGDAGHYDREYCVDLVQLRGFLRTTQEDVLESLQLDTDGPTRRKFLARLQGEITKRGTIDVLRHGIKHGPHQIDLFCGTPSPGNEKAAERYACNRFSVTRQLRYSRDETQRALDMALFINGLPVASFELKNSLTKQTVADAVAQYQRDRDPREKLFELLDPFECFSAGQLGSCVDRMIAVGIAKPPDRVEVFHREPQRVHLDVARGTARIATMLLHLLAQRTGELTLAFQRNHIRQRRRWRFGQQRFEHPLAALHRRRAVGVGRNGQNTGVRENAAAGRAVQADTLEFLTVV